MAVQAPWAAAVLTEWLDGKTIKVMLLDPLSAHDSTIDSTLSLGELTDPEYSAGGLTVTLAVEVGLDGSVVVTGTPGSLNYGALTATVGGAAAYEPDTGIVLFIDWFDSFPTTGGGFSYILPSDGLVLVAVD